jgi:hypothetical protein
VKPPEQKEVTTEEILADMVMDQLSTDVVDYKPHYLRVAKQTFETVNSVMGLGVNLTDDVETRILTEGGKRVGLIDLSKQSREAVFRALEEAREAGEGPLQAARRIRDHVSRGRYLSPETRAKVIARTETKYAQNVSSLEAYRTSGTIDRIQIVDGQLGPDRSCDICMERDGMIVTFAEAEAISASEHPNGTLSLIPVVGER